jgi:hypothetical protein
MVVEEKKPAYCAAITLIRPFAPNMLSRVAGTTKM